MSMSKKWRLRCEVIGWVLFTISACFFVWTSLKAGDVIGLLGGLFFLIACFFFMAPYVAGGHSD